MMNLNEVFTWEFQLQDGTIYREGDAQFKSWKELLGRKIVRISLVSDKVTHDCIIDVDSGEHLIRKFSRGFIGISSNGLKDYIHCIQTNRYRMWVLSSTGKVIITRYDYELYL